MEMRTMILGLCLLALSVSTVAQLEISKPYYDTTPFAPGVSHRQNICNRFDAFQNGTVELRDALKGMELRPILSWWGEDDQLLRYDPMTGIDTDYPGILVNIMDALALRAGFTWRHSFGIMQFPPPENKTYADMIEWAVDTYDIALDWFTRTPERMERGITFLDPWRDGSIILVAKSDGSLDTNPSLTNFLRPFDSSVWLLILFTVVLSALVFQFIEYLQGEQDDRSLWQWTSDNLYLSAINFSQNFEYGPTSFGGRVFAVSMTLWALLICATYTANLASLLVESKQTQGRIESIEQAIQLNMPICVTGGGATNRFIQSEYERANLVALDTDIESYEALQAGKCTLLLTNKDPWLLYKGDSRFNPDCDMEWVGRKVKQLDSGFAVKTDIANDCTSFIRNVLNIHLVEIAEEGYLERYKNRFRRRFQEQHPSPCRATGAEEEEVDSTAGGQRMLKQITSRHEMAHGRGLKAAGKAPTQASPDQDHDDSSSLTLEQMIGTFVLHWCMMALAVLITGATTYFARQQEHIPKGDPTTQPERAPASTLGSDTSHTNIDWEARYAQLSDREKAVVDVLFRLDVASPMGMIDDSRLSV